MNDQAQPIRTRPTMTRPRYDDRIPLQPIVANTVPGPCCNARCRPLPSHGHVMRKPQPTRRHRARTSKQGRRRNLQGRWTLPEHFAFLYCLRTLGAGCWSKYVKSIPTRSAKQINTHATVCIAKMERGEDIFYAYDKYKGDVNAYWKDLNRPSSNTHPQPSRCVSAIPMNDDDRTSVVTHPHPTRLKIPQQVQTYDVDAVHAALALLELHQPTGTARLCSAIGNRSGSNSSIRREE